MAQSLIQSRLQDTVPYYNDDQDPPLQLDLPIRQKNKAIVYGNVAHFPFVSWLIKQLGGIESVNRHCTRLDHESTL